MGGLYLMFILITHGDINLLPNLCLWRYSFCLGAVPDHEYFQRLIWLSHLSRSDDIPGRLICLWKNSVFRYCYISPGRHRLDACERRKDHRMDVTRLLELKRPGVRTLTLLIVFYTFNSPSSGIAINHIVTILAQRYKLGMYFAISNSWLVLTPAMADAQMTEKIENGAINALPDNWIA